MTELTANEVKQKLTPADVVDSYLSAIAARDFERARTWLADAGFSSRSPMMACNDADEYIANISRIGPILEAVKRRKTFVDKSEVCVILDYVTRMDTRHVFPFAHLMQIDGAKITHIESIFDTHWYASMFDVD
jgi:hypothetical protein